MIKRILPLILAGGLLLTGCSADSDSSDKIVEGSTLTYSNLVDEEIQNEIENILIENNVSKDQADYFMEVVKDYNKKSKLEKLPTSKKGYRSIATQQVPYDEAILGEIWDYKKINYVDFNCRVTAFTLFKDFINSQEKFNGDEVTLMFDLETMKSNPVSKFSNEDIDKFTNLYGSIPVENTQDVNKLAETIIKEWEKRKISFGENDSVSMINIFIHAPEDSMIFTGHAGVLVKVKDGLIFIEKYSPSLPYQVSKFKDKSELKTYLMDRLDVNTADNGAAKPIIMENNKVM